MPSMNMKIPHQLTPEEAMSRIQRLLTEVKAEHGDRVTDLQESWSGNRGEFAFKAMGFAVSGTLDVRPGEVELNGNYPLAARPFKGRIESLVRDQATRLLTP